MSLTLVSFSMCPYVLRVAAALYHYNIQFELKFIDIANPPDWFKKLSPLQKVPILLVGEEVIFESNVILDYVNTLIGNKGLPENNLQRAQLRSKMEFSSEVLTSFASFTFAKEQNQYQEKLGDLLWYFERLEDWLQKSKYIGGNEITLADFSFSPIFVFLRVVAPLFKEDPFAKFARLKEYAAALNSIEGVRKAQVDGYDELVLKELTRPYQLIREIGSGSFARVYKGRTEGSQEDVAIKMIQKQNIRVESLAAIEKEIEILRQFNHPNIIKLIDAKKTSNHHYLIFEYCENGDLDNYIRKYTPSGMLPEDEVRRIVQQLALALKQMHKLRIVHRDLKLANILVSKNYVIKLADFGFAKFMEDNQYLTSYCGTPLTMAPEILKREKYNDKCDVWSVGVIIYQMLFGRFPFNPPKGGNINDLLKVIENTPIEFPAAPTISSDLKQMLIHMLQKDFKKRMNFLEFFKHKWLQVQVQDDYIQSIKQDNQEQQQEITQVHHHKISEDIQEDELGQQENFDPFNESAKELQLKFIGYQLQKQAINYLDIMFNEINKINELVSKIVNQKMKFQFLQEKVNTLYLSIVIYKALLIQQINEFMNEQVVVLHTQSSTSSQLICLQMQKPFVSYEIILKKEKIDLMRAFNENQQIIQQFKQSGLCIADNIFDETIELIMNLIEHCQPFDNQILKTILQLLQSFVQAPPQFRQVELHMNLETGNDMNYYWHLFKLVRVNQEKIAQQIENEVIQDTIDFDHRLSFQWNLVRDENEEIIAFNQNDLDIIASKLDEYSKITLSKQQ